MADKITLRDVQVSGAVFRVPGMGDLQVLVGECPDSRDLRAADGFIDEWGMGEWWAVYVYQGFDGPVCIVRADGASEAEEWWADSPLVKWAAIDDEEDDRREAEGLGDTVGYGPSGQRYDQEKVSIYPAVLQEVIA